MSRWIPRKTLMKNLNIINLLRNLLNRKIRPLCTLLRAWKKARPGGLWWHLTATGRLLSSYLFWELVFEINSDIKMPQIFEGCKSFKRGPIACPFPHTTLCVIPAQTGIQENIDRNCHRNGLLLYFLGCPSWFWKLAVRLIKPLHWIPAFARMTCYLREDERLYSTKLILQIK